MNRICVGMVDVNDPTRYPILRLKSREEKRLLAGHLWVYSNEVDIQRTPLKRFQPGQAVMITTASAKVIGTGYVNPKSLICARLISYQADEGLGGDLIKRRLSQALKLREQLYPEPYYRLVFGEGDALPGLVIDRYGDYFAGQITTAGMQKHQSEIEAALDDLLQPKSLVWRNDVGIRRFEGLDESVEQVFGSMPEDIQVKENGLKFTTSLTHGQKTGWFYDQARNRDRLQSYVKGSRVLDCYSYLGGWGLRALQAGAQTTVCVDSSQRAIEGIKKAASDNDLLDQLSACKSDVLDYLKTEKEENNQYDVIIVDPPALIKRKKDFRDGIRAYQKVNEAALRLLAPNGILFSFSCSQHLSRDDLRKTVQRAARRAGMTLQVLEPLSQGPDHPIHPAMPETEYLKGYVFRRLSC